MWEFCAKVFSAMRDFMGHTSAYYNEGWDAYFNFERLEDNPYPESTMAHCDWETGWTAAEDEAEDREVVF